MAQDKGSFKVWSYLVNTAAKSGIMWLEAWLPIWKLMSQKPPLCFWDRKGMLSPSAFHHAAWGMYDTLSLPMLCIFKADLGSRGHKALSPSKVLLKGNLIPAPFINLHFHSSRYWLWHSGSDCSPRFYVSNKLLGTALLLSVGYTFE